MFVWGLPSADPPKRDEVCHQGCSQESQQICSPAKFGSPGLDLGFPQKSLICKWLRLATYWLLVHWGACKVCVSWGGKVRQRPNPPKFIAKNFFSSCSVVMWPKQTSKRLTPIKIGWELAALNHTFGFWFYSKFTVWFTETRMLIQRLSKLVTPVSTNPVVYPSSKFKLCDGHEWGLSTYNEVYIYI